ncbi:MAG: toll/interleukin-1 receptor domain-containing protein [Muribaculaceae bacterium]|nr:toll/interleukin-1 receptor domain-containing protein [Muribaculaceae bacterium]
MKVFLSHSSKQKKFIREVADCLGRDIAVVDEYVFESGRDIWQEIDRAIESCDIFVLFISKEALESEWVKKEYNFVRNLVDEKKISFIAYLVDDTSPQLPDIPAWVRNIILRLFVSPMLVARSIKKEISKIYLQRNHNDDPHGTYFIGRDTLIGRYREGIYCYDQGCLRAVIASGMPYIGRKRLLREVMNAVVREDRERSYRPIQINLDENDSLPELVGILNDTTQLYSNGALIDKMQSNDAAINAAVEQFNAIAQVGERVIIDDNGALILRNGRFIDWFEDLLKHPDLTPQIHFFIASRNALTFSKKLESYLVAHRVPTLDKSAMSSLFKAYSTLMDVEIRQEHEADFLKAFKGYPDVLYNTVDLIKNEGYLSARKFLNDAGNIHSNEVAQAVGYFQSDENSYSMLVLLANFEFVPFPTLVDMYGHSEIEVINILDTLSRAGMCERFGKDGFYIRLAPPVRDYITRKKIQLKDSINKRLRSKLTMYADALEAGEDAPADFGTLLISIKEQIREKGLSNKMKKLLLPTFVLKVIIEEYNAGRYDYVRELAEKVLYDYGNNYDSQLTPIRYWLCLAIARRGAEDDKGEQTMLKESEALSDYKKHFVRGFYQSCRNKPDYSKAAREYKKALSHINPNEPLEGIKAKHQLVVCYQKLGNYGDALSLARDCYESDKSNAYYIQAYFESVVRTNKDIVLLDELIDVISKQNENNTKALCAAMRAQYRYFVYGDYGAAKQIIEDVVSDEHDVKMRNMLLRVLKEICLKANDRSTYGRLNDKYGKDARD